MTALIRMELLLLGGRHVRPHKQQKRGQAAPVLPAQIFFVDQLLVFCNRHMSAAKRGEQAMIRITFCLKRLPGMTREEFQDYWRNTHAPLVRANAEALGIRKYVQSHTISEADRFPGADVRGSSGKDYDGVAQLWWDDKAAFIAAGDTEAGRVAGATLLEDEKNFIDLENSPIFLSEDFLVID
jgi:uncharacterized protein (TIGR02118 family)